MAPQPYLITGRRDTGGTFDRLSIESLQEDEPKQFSLFILADLVIQGRRSVVDPIVHADYSSALLEQDILSSPAGFPQIAGIHGLPYKEYTGDPRDPAARASDYNENDKKDMNPIPSRFGGYCNHGAVLFPTWHRPYVMLIEACILIFLRVLNLTFSSKQQAIGNVADIIAAALETETVDLSEQGDWIFAGKALRFPYWDWAEERVARDGLPSVLSDETVKITVADGEEKTIPNPLSYYLYDNRRVPSGFQDKYDPSSKQTAYYSKWLRTFRHAESSPRPARSNNEELQNALKSHASDIRNKVASLFTYDVTGDSSLVWDEFSNHTTESLRKEDYYNACSLEGVHDMLHDIIGGNGHMSDPDYAGFDPIFFLHHCNVDRLFALWEWCYPDYWMGYGYTQQEDEYAWTQSRGTYAEVYNEEVTQDSALYPFRNVYGNYWTSGQARFLYPGAFNKYYSYPAVAGVKVNKKGTDITRTKGRAALQRYYGLSPNKESRELTATNPKIFKPPSTAPKKSHAVGDYRRFIVVVILPEHAFNHSYSFRLFYKNGRREAIIGSVSVFARPDHSACAGCRRRRVAGTKVRGVIHLPIELVDRIIGADTNLNNENVDEDALPEGIIKHFHGRLVDSTERLLGRADAGKEVPLVEADRVLPNHVTPSKVVLLSASAAHLKRKKGPAVFYDWKRHVDLFPSGWENMVHSP